jgi:hypothetical protein
LLVTGVRRWALAILAASALLVTVMGVLFAGRTTADRLDRAIDAPIIGWFGGHPGLALRLAAPGSLIPAAALSAAVVVCCLLAGRPNGALLGLLAVPLSVGLVERVLKPAFGRTYGGNLTYPSGHATALFAIAATSAVLLAPTRPGNFRALRIAIPVMMSLVGCAVAAGVIGLRWHYFTDTVAGACRQVVLCPSRSHHAGD